jgi:hypothetical protein
MSKKKQSSLEFLLQKAADVNQRYLSQLSKYAREKEYSDRNLNFMYQTIYNDLSENLSSFDFSESDIVQLISRYFSFGEDGLLQADVNKTAGNPLFALYTSVLLHILTERNEQKGRRTIIHLKDIAMDYLFHYVQKADTIILENCRGNEVLACAGAFEGRINAIILKNFGASKGRDGEDSTISVPTDVLSDIASHNGYVGTVILSGVHGAAVASGAASYNGHVNAFIARDIDSSLFCSSLCKESGTMNLCYLNGISVQNSLFHGAFALTDKFASPGNLRYLFTENVKIDLLLLQQKIDFEVASHIEHLDIESLKTKNTLEVMQRYSVPMLLEVLSKKDYLSMADIAWIVRACDEINAIKYR